MRFANQLLLPEGPVFLPDGSLLAVEMAAERGCVSNISKDGKTISTLAKTGRPNGLALDRNNIVWVAESSKPSLLKMEMNGLYEVFLTACGNEEFIFPNDLIFGPHGELYLTDSGIDVKNLFGSDGKLLPNYMDLKCDGKVYQINTNTKQINKIDSDIQFTNGIAFGPDNYLYVNETFTGKIFRYKWEDGMIVSGREDFVQIDKGPDGMKFSKSGNLYCTVYNSNEVTVINPIGKIIGHLQTKDFNPTNIVFGSPGENKVFVTTAPNGIEIFDVGEDGFPLYK